MSGEHIQAVENFECADDAEVISKSSALLNTKPEHPAVEIWEGKRLVARLTKNLLADTNAQHGGTFMRSAASLNDLADATATLMLVRALTLHLIETKTARANLTEAPLF